MEKLLLHFCLLETSQIITAWKLSVFGVALVRISPYSVRMRENTDQKNCKNGHFLRSEYHDGDSWKILVVRHAVNTEVFH